MSRAAIVVKCRLEDPRRKGTQVTGIRPCQWIVLAATALAISGAACGQMPGGAGTGRGARGGESSRMGINRSADQDVNPAANVLAVVQYRLDQLDEDLRLTPDQRPAWLVYRERVLRMAEDSQRAARAALGGDMPAPARLDKLADIARDRLTAVEDIVDAGKSLYATLTPAQQLVADRRMAAPVTALAGVEPTGGARGAPPRGGAAPSGNP